ncbi:hypothetical protein TRICI_006598 [Trichomonascus ciferrii]|uniref:UBX domain-containing protein n=1 Tax=Trichomonascus ciferrii TaxID=44093 RepID=A0A642UMX5_9ASCO|nr:hypothetical protein TRICI_006598 [Trichomonascus ciferrii]
MAELSAEQETSLATFMEITNWEGGRDDAVRLLESSNWNVETAVMLHFDGGVEQAPPSPPPRPPQMGGSSGNSARSAPTSLMEELHSAQPVEDEAPRVGSATPPVYRPRENSGFSIIQTVLSSPLILGYKMFNSLLYLLSWLFPFLPRLTGYYPANRNATRSEYSGSSGEAAAARFVQDFEETYRTGQSDHLPPFFKGGYTQAFDHAKANLRYLVVVLLSDEHDLTPKFCREALLAGPMLDFLNRSDMVLWAGDVKNSEAYQVANGLQATSFPFVCLIAPSPKTPTSNLLVMSVLTRIKGLTDPSRLLSILEEKVETHQPKLMSLVLDKQERDMSRRLREEQDSAYERSLAADRERERRAREDQEAREREEQRQKQQEEEKQERERLSAQWRRWRTRQLRQKLDQLQNSTERLARVSLRLLTGERVVQKFDPSDSVEEIYAFVECYHELQKPNDESEYDDLDKPEGYTHKYTFELVSPMPRKVLAPDTALLIRDENTVWPNGSLVVEIGDDSDDDEEG